MTVDMTGRNTDCGRMITINDLLSVAHAYQQSTGLETTAVSWRVFGDSKKLGALEDGKDIQVKRFVAAMRWFASNWPEDAVWPAGVPVPESTDEVVPASHGAAA